MKFIFILLFLPLSISATQTNYDKIKKNKLQLGVGFNINGSWMTGFDKINSSVYRKTEESLDGPMISMGFIIISIDYFINPWFSISISPQFNRQGARFKYFETSYHELGISEKNRFVMEKINYFRVPITLNYYLTSNLSISGGTYVSAMASANRDDPERSAYTEYDSFYYRHYRTDDVSNNYRDADLGLIAGTALELGRFKIAASYAHGMLNVSNMIDRSHYNRSINLSILFKFLNRKHQP